MRYFFIFSLICVGVLAAVCETANGQLKQQKSSQINVHFNRNRSLKPETLATHQHRLKPATKRVVAKSHRNAAKKLINKKAKGVLVNRNGKKRRAVVKSNPKKKVVRAIRKTSRRVNRVKPSRRSQLIRRRTNQRKRFAKQEEADIENADQEGFDEEQQNVNSGASESGVATNDQPAADQSTIIEDSNTVNTGPAQPIQPDPAIQQSSPQFSANLPSNFNQITKNADGKNIGIGFASASTGNAIAVGYATSVNGQNSAGGFGASFSAPDLLNSNQPDSSTNIQESNNELAQYRRPRRNNHRQDKFYG